MDWEKLFGHSAHSLWDGGGRDFGGVDGLRLFRLGAGEG